MNKNAIYQKWTTANQHKQIPMEYAMSITTEE